MKTLKDLIEARAKLVEQADAINKKATDEKRDLSADEGKQVDGILAEIDTTSAEIETLEKAETRAAKLTAMKALATRQTKSADVDANPETRAAIGGTFAEKRDKVLATARTSGTLRNFPNTKDGQFEAYRFGMWAIACASHVYGGGRRAMRYCKENGLPFISERDAEEDRASIGHQENINFNGGYLVPDEFNNQLIVLREKYGVFRAWAKQIPMTRDTSSRPRRTSGLTASFVGEGAAGTSSTKSWDYVSLQAKKLMCLSLYTSELNEDAVINIGDDLAGEIAYAFANKEDNCGFLGDGTSTYGGIIGVTSAFSKLGTAANSAGIVAGSGSAWTGLVLSDFNNVVARLPEYADTPNVAWYCHRTFWASVMQKLMYAVGGNKVADIAGPAPKEFLGYPVRISQVLPKTSASTQYACFFGDMSLAADFGDRRQNTIAFSNQATVGSVNAFAQDALAIRGTERFDINVHDVGNNSATAALRVAGPLVALLTS